MINKDQSYETVEAATRDMPRVEFRIKIMTLLDETSLTSIAGNH